MSAFVFPYETCGNPRELIEKVTTYPEPRLAKLEISGATSRPTFGASSRNRVSVTF
jgi:hypothetical protein